MKCLIKYKWVKLPRDLEIDAKGLMTYYTRLATRVAFRKGMAHYCGFENPVVPVCGPAALGVSKVFCALRAAVRPTGF